MPRIREDLALLFSRGWWPVVGWGTSPTMEHGHPERGKAKSKPLPVAAPSLGGGVVSRPEESSGHWDVYTSRVIFVASGSVTDGR